MPPEATMMTHPPPSSRSAQVVSVYPVISNCHRDGRARRDTDVGEVGEMERWDQPQTRVDTASRSGGDGYPSRGQTPSSPDRCAHGNMPFLDDRERPGMAQKQLVRDEPHLEDGAEIGLKRKRPSNGPLHQTLNENFQCDLNSLREATFEALQLSYKEQERLCMEGERLESRIANMRKKVELAKGELLAKGVAGGDMMEDEFRLSQVKEGEEERSSCGLRSLDEEDTRSQLSEDASEEPASAMKRINSSQKALNANLSSKRFNMLSSLHSSQNTHVSGGSTSVGGEAGMPHMSRSSLLGMLGASKNWLDNYASSTSNGEEEGARSSNASFRLSFMEGAAGDGMPSRWRAREQERAESERQKEEEERRMRDQVQNKGDGIPTSRRRRDKSRGEKLQDLITKMEGEISALEQRALSVERQTSSLRDEIVVFQKDQQQAEGKFEQERTKLLDELGRVQLDNQILDREMVETGVSLEEKKISMEILARELKEARDELARAQNERDRRRAERRGVMSRKWSSMRNSMSSLLGTDGPEDSESLGELHQSRCKGKGTLTRYQVPTHAMHQYRTLVGSSDDDTDDDNVDNSGSSSGDHHMERRGSRTSIGTCMSSLTLDSYELVDILEQLELDS